VSDDEPVRRAKGKIKGHGWGQGQMQSPGPRDPMAFPSEY
jgi:hypothetical protein